MPADITEHAINPDGMRDVARRALAQILEPLLGFVIDSGLSPQELHLITREAAIRTVAVRQLQLAQRVNISGIAASTGIPRSEISKILGSSAKSPRRLTDRQQQSTNRVLAVWHQDPKFTTPAGKPADLKIYGRGATFETLVRNCGKGIPTRAMLDELTRINAAEVLPSGSVRARTSVAVERGLSARAIRSFGVRVTELMTTMLQNMRNPDAPTFVASVSGSNAPVALLPLFRKELANKGADFLAEIQDLIMREAPDQSSNRNANKAGRISVTIFCHETQNKRKPKKNIAKKRQNLKRMS